MSTKRRAAWISVVVVSLITITKFIFFSLSGSAAVLSESWHGFSDLLTSLFVLIFIYRSKKSKPLPSPSGEESLIKKVFRLLWNIDSDNKAALLISALLFIISITIFLNILFYPAAIKVSFPLETGVTFVILSIGSYFLYHFQSSLGRSVKSAAIVADGMHSKADMVIALMTALSLFLYYFNINVDRYIGLLTSFYIFITAIEMMINTILSIKGDSTHISLTNILKKGWSYTAAYLLKTPLLSLWKRYKKRLLFTVLLSLLVGYGSTAFYTVDTERSAILLRIGKVVNKTEPIAPGLHLKYPWPIDRV
ncbi:cation transporter, partial [bacterium]|nr:cation transporter [bacterium]